MISAKCKPFQNILIHEYRSVKRHSNIERKPEMGDDSKQYHHLRRDYQAAQLDSDHLADDPIEQFQEWFDEALQENMSDPNAMTLATADEEGRPSARIVLLKSVEQGCFSFYTNYNSRKGQELIANPHASLVFFWPQHERQIRIEGIAEKLSSRASDEYFLKRPRNSQIGAIASPQSQIIRSREELENKVKEVEEEFANEDHLPRPEHWGGFLVMPYRIEFWQGRESRLHDRIEYSLEKNESWRKVRLAP